MISHDPRTLSYKNGVLEVDACFFHQFSLAIILAPNNKSDVGDVKHSLQVSHTHTHTNRPKTRCSSSRRKGSEK